MLAHARASICVAADSELQSAGLPITVVGARHMRVSLSTMRNKTDRNDARGIAQVMRLGWYRAVHVKNIDMQKMRTLLTSRKLLKRKLIDLKNHIRGALRPMDCLTEPSPAGHMKHASAS
jgi:transposase